MLVRRDTPKRATCHPEREVKGRGLCGACYNRQYNREWKLRNPEKAKDQKKRDRARARQRKEEQHGQKNAGRSSATCHPDRPLKAHGLCQQCYRKWWKKQHPERVAAWKRDYKARHPELHRGLKAAQKYKEKYGITLRERDEIVAAQGGLCAICRERPATSTDHCHKSGKFRAMLCNSCNTGLGHFRDNTGFMRTAIEYLQRHSGENTLPAGIWRVTFNR